MDAHGRPDWREPGIKPGSSLDHTIVEGDVNGDARADFQIDLSGLINFTATDFIL